MKNSCNVINRFLFVLFLGSLTSNAFSQVKCGTRTSAGPVLTVPAEYARQQSISGMKMIKLFIHVTRPEYMNAQPAQSEDEILAHIQYLQIYFAPHGICFIIQGMDEIIDNDIAFIDPDNDGVPTLMQAYVQPGCLNVFVHNDISGDVIGKAWNIPNTLLSLQGDYTWSGFPMLAAHEIGHCLGLYHTFEDNYGKELVARSGACSNCNIAGDFICDTPADIQAPGNQFSNCHYVGNIRDSCNNLYETDPSNLMSYYEFASCLPYEHFSPQQGLRCNYYIDNTPSLQATLLTANAFTETNSQNYSSSAIELVYRDNITINSSAYLSVNTARIQMTSAEVVIKPGAHFTPGNGGLVVIRANSLCQ